MINRRYQLDYRFVVLWAMSVLVGVIFFFFLAGVPLAFAGLNTGLWLLVIFSTIGLAGGAVTGLVVGLIQRAILPKKIPLKKHWIRISVAGWAFGGAVWCFIVSVLQLAFFEYPKQGVDENTGILLSAITTVLSGLSIGVIQSLYMRGEPSSARFWLIATFRGWILGGLIWAILVYLVPQVRDQKVYDFFILVT